MKLSTQLRSMQKLLATPDDWTIGSLAKPKQAPDNYSTHPSASNAQCFCIVGAAARAIHVPMSEDNVYGAVANSSLGRLLASVIAGRWSDVWDLHDERDFANGVRTLQAGGACKDEVAMILYRFNDTARERHGAVAMAHAEVLSVIDEAYLHAHAAGLEADE